MLPRRGRLPDAKSIELEHCSLWSLQHDEGCVAAAAACAWQARASLDGSVLHRCDRDPLNLAAAIFAELAFFDTLALYPSGLFGRR